MGAVFRDTKDKLIKKKEWHIWDFPKNKIRIKLKNNKGFLQENIDYFGSIKNMAGFLGIQQTTISGWKQNNLFIPLEDIKKIVKARKLNWRVLEKEIIAYKGPNLSLQIRIPQLPIKESPELFAIITNLIGDGCVNKKGIPIYTNSCKNLIDNFNKLIKKVFGNAEYKIYKRKTDNNYNYRTSKVIADLLKSFYKGIEFDSLTAKFPNKFIKMSSKHILGIIRAIVDDEGYIGDNSIAIKMKNKILIKQIKKILIRIFGEYSTYDIETKGGLYAVNLKSAYLKDFKDRIKLVHPKKQQDLKDNIVRIKYRGNGEGEGIWQTKMQILRILNKKKNSLSNLSKKLLITKSNIRNHISYLIDLGLVKKIIREYKITRGGHNFLIKNDFSKSKIKIKLNTLYYNRLNKKDNLILIDEICRKKLFWFLRLLYANDYNIGKKLRVNYNTIGTWKNGKRRISAKTLNRILILLSKKGINLVEDVNKGLKEIITNNGYIIWEV